MRSSLNKSVKMIRINCQTRPSSRFPLAFLDSCLSATSSADGMVPRRSLAVSLMEKWRLEKAGYRGQSMGYAQGFHRNRWLCGASLHNWRLRGTEHWLSFLWYPTPVSDLLGTQYITNGSPTHENGEKSWARRMERGQLWE